MTFKPALGALGAAVVAVAGASGWWLLANRHADDRDVIRVSGNIEITDAELSFKIPGRVEKRLVDEGHLVEQAQPVAELESADLEHEVAMRRADLEAAEDAWEELENGSRPEEKAAAQAARDAAEAAWLDLKAGSREQEILAAEAEFRRAEAQRDQWENDYKRASQLIERAGFSAISREEFDRIKAAYEAAVERAEAARQNLALAKAGSREHRIQQAEAALRQAEAELALVLDGPRAEKIAAALARKKQAEAALRLAETRLGYARLVSPMRGVVLSKNVEPGEYVAPGTPVVTVGDLEHPWLRAYINETDLGRVKHGQRVRVTTDSYPGKVYEGRVSFIASEAEFTPKNVQTEEERVKLVYRIKIDVPNPEMDLKPGMPADAEILLGTDAEQGVESRE
jgi:HlyD family secretion protein